MKVRSKANGLSKHRKDKDKEEHRVKNDDEIDEPHKSQLKFKYKVYLLNYTIKTKLKKQPKLGF